MPNYTWKGRTRAGKTQEGVLVAENKDAAIAMLRKQQVTVTAVTEKGKEFALPKMGGGISQKEIAVFTRQFSVMIDAGLPLVQCLEILGSQQDNRIFQKILFEVRQDIESGGTLADSLRKHPKAFDDLYCNMVAAGETGGILDTILQRLSQYIEKIVKLRAAVRSAMVYPVAVILIAIGVVWIILWKVIPTFATLFAGLGAQLPLPTRITIALSQFIGAWWWAIFLTFGLLDLLALPVPQDLHGAAPYRRYSPQAARPGERLEEDRGGAVLPHAGNARVLGRADPRGLGDHRQDRR